MSSSGKATDTGDVGFICRMASESVEALFKSEHYVPALCVMVCCIDGFTGSGTNRDEYKKLLEEHFPGLIGSKLSGDQFYCLFRSGVVHNYLKEECGIWPGGEQGEYICRNDARYPGRPMLNIDRFKRDFLLLVEKVKKGKVTIP